MHAEYVLEMKNISKTFPGVRALNNVQLKVKKGTVHALMGENGAGKSTLMKILIGMYRPDGGTIKFKGKEVKFKSTHDALQAGISMIHQELSPVPYMTIAENIFLGRESLYKKTFWVNDREMERKTEELLKQLEISLNPKMKMKELSTAYTQMVEIAKAISYNSELIIMDEPTSAITEREVEHLFKIIEWLKKKGVSIIYISHKMDEIFKIADEITVFRDGSYVDTCSVKNITKEKLIEMMVGREITQLFPKEEAEIGKVLLEIKNFTRAGKFYDINLKVRKGEILGLAGLMGSGRSEIMESLFGVVKADKGEIYIKGKQVHINSPADAIKHKLAFLTEDRKISGLFLPLSVKDNMYISSINNYIEKLFINSKKVNKDCEEEVKLLNIKTPGLDQIVNNLSGGNQQKVLIARWLLTDPDILILDEPTRGIDVGAKAEIHRLMSKLAKQGKAIIMISSELPEILGMSDRIVVMHEGKITGELTRKEATQEKIMSYATGAAS
ncbi:monosaccharide ABC transporter ATP-binding protein (CUT2 family) [Fonticella tunisiensis]|uniref:Ribose/galactose/methyl galactoside import ATP-binding protein n=2 Tax=Fonticella tunisiensis TaxID=1096341 RepID=A0A4R7KLC1_9CLOT|nr:monosaccharide ABC transporter ATP-binding protein (CUT2 family) [Fonticella tunisiensis]